MSASAIELALFPLNIVLFPGTVRPLHIFEPRYRQMIKDCIKEQKPFGLVLAKESSEHLKEQTYTIGTMAEIHNLSRLEDGCYNLMAVGTTRFRILHCHHENPYLSGLVEPFNDEPVTEEELRQPAAQVRHLFMAYLNMLLEAPDQEDIEISLPDESEDLSHFVAYFLDIDDRKKQHYLELTSTRQRLEDEIAFLRREVPFMRQILFHEPAKEKIALN